MKSISILSFITLAVATTTASDVEGGEESQKNWPRELRENPTKRTPVRIATPYGEIQWGEFISLMEQPHRQLQGNGNNPNACNADGEYFVCNTPNVLTQGGNETKVDNTIRCLLDPAIGFDFQAKPQDCTCSAVLTDSNSGSSRTCNCAPCPYGRAQAVALDCSNNADDPFIAGPCVSLDCDARCNGTGAAVLNQPTPAPNADPAAAPTDDASGVTNVGMMIGVLIGTAMSFVSVYM